MKTFYQLIAIFISSALISCTKENASANGVPSNGAGGSTARFTIAGNYLYVVDNLSLKAFDISTNNSPVYKSKTDIGINIETIFPYDDKLFIGSSSTMYIYSITDPSRPTRVGKAEYTAVRMSCDPVVAKDSVAYATLRANNNCGGGQSALVVYNIKDPSSPQLMKTVSLIGPYGLGIKSNALYVCEAGLGLYVYNTTKAYDPRFVSYIRVNGTSFYDVIPYGNILIAQVNDGFILYDIGTNPLQPAFLSRISN